MFLIKADVNYVVLDHDGAVCIKVTTKYFLFLFVCRWEFNSISKVFFL